MKSIENTLELINRTLHSFKDKCPIQIALIGGYAVIAHGYERTTRDIDFLINVDHPTIRQSQDIADLFQESLPEQFEVLLMKGSKSSDDPFQHDVIFIKDENGDYPRIDLILARYKWEAEGIQTSTQLGDFPMPILSKPYLIAMKLKAGSFKDDLDIYELYQLLTKDEKQKTHDLSKLIHRDTALSKILEPRSQIRDKEDRNLLL